MEQINNSKLQEIDEQISKISNSIDFYASLTPINKIEEKKLFFQAIKDKKTYNPLFEYKRKNLFKYEVLLKDMKKGLISDGISGILKKKIDFLLLQIDLCDAPDEEFVEVSNKLYGGLVPEEEEFAYNIISEMKGKEVFCSETVTPEALSSALKSYMREKGIDWKIQLNEKIVPKISVSGKDKSVFVNPDFMYTEDEIQRLKVHEIGVHVCRGANGDRQSFNVFREGLAGYDDTEEGIAVFAEDISGCLNIDVRQMLLYAGRYIGVSKAVKSSFYETFLSLCEFFPEEFSYRLAERSKRGLRDTSINGAFTKELGYIKGYKKIKEYVASGGDLSILYIGKIGLGDIDIVQKLLESGELEKPKYLPDFIENVGEGS